MEGAELVMKVQLDEVSFRRWERLYKKSLALQNKRAGLNKELGKVTAMENALYADFRKFWGHDENPS